MKTLLLVVLLGLVAAASSQVYRCVDGTKWYDGCNYCTCTGGVPACTERACISKRSTGADQFECSGEGIHGWLDDCNWCTCEDGEANCELQETCVSGEETFPECTGTVTWMRDCNRCHCGETGVAGCTKKFCFPRD